MVVSYDDLGHMQPTLTAVWSSGLPPTLTDFETNTNVCHLASDTRGVLTCHTTKLEEGESM